MLRTVALSTLFALLVAVDSTDGIESGQWKQFQCVEQELKALGQIVAMTAHNRDLYIYFKDKMVKQSVPRFHLEGQERMLVSSLPLVLDYQATLKRKPTLLDEKNVCGYVQRIDKSKKYTQKVIVKEANKLVVKELNMDTGGDVGAKDEQLTQKMENRKFQLFNSIEDEETNSVSEWWYAADLKNPTLNLWHKNSTLYNNRFQNNYVTTWSVLYYFASEPSDDGLSVVPLDIDSAQTVRITSYSVVRKSSSDSTSLRFKNDGIQVYLDDLWSCLLPFNSSRQLKGVFYETSSDEGDSVFYLFVKDFYLIFKGDLVESRLLVNDPSVYQQAKYLKFDKLTSITQVKHIERLTYNYVKTLHKQSVLAFYSDTSFKLERTGDPKERLLIAKDQRPRIVQKCMRNTLEVDKMIFCFEDTTYNFLANLSDLEKPSLIRRTPMIQTDSKPIRKIFALSDITWDEDEGLRFIFNYKNNTFCMLTRANLYFINYELLEVDEDLNIKLKVKNNIPPAQYSKRENCLYDPRKCHVEGPTISIDEPSTVGFIVEEPQSKLDLIITIISIIVFIFFCIVVLVIIRHDKGKSIQHIDSLSKPSSPGSLKSKEMDAKNSSVSMPKPKDGLATASKDASLASKDGSARTSNSQQARTSESVSSTKPMSLKGIAGAGEAAGSTKNSAKDSAKGNAKDSANLTESGKAGNAATKAAKDTRKRKASKARRTRSRRSSSSASSYNPAYNPAIASAYTMQNKNSVVPAASQFHSTIECTMSVEDEQEELRRKFRKLKGYE